MRIPFISRPYSTLAASLALLAISTASGFGQATTVTTDPVGFYSTVCSGTSDTILSAPFTQPAAFVGSLSSVSGSNVLVVSSTANFTVNQFVYSGSSQPNSYYAFIGPVASATTGKEGCIYSILSNGTNSLTVNLNGDSISALVAGVQVSVIPYWTFNTLFPASNAGISYTVSTSSRTSGIQTEVLTPNTAAQGINIAPSSIYYYLNSAWRLYGDSATVDHGNDVILPNYYFVLRNTGTASTTFTPLGSVVTKRLNINLITSSSTQQDNQVSLTRPVAVPLNNLGLISSGAFASSTSSRTSGLTDELLVFGSGITGFNLAPTSIYYYYNSAWRLFGDSSTADHGSDTITAGSGLIVRKAAGTGTTAFWKNDSTY